MSIASQAAQFYNLSRLWALDATALYSLTTNWKLALVTSTYTPDAEAHTVYADLTNELTTANGYTAGGLALTGVALSRTTGTVKFTFSAAVWTASGGSIAAWRRAVLYQNATINGHVKPLSAYFLGDATNIDIPATTDTNTLTFTPAAGGFFTLT